MDGYAKLIEEYRGDQLENTHYGYICVVDKDSGLILSTGDPDAKVYYRSASKPVQALPTIALGIDREFGLSEEECAIMAGSHTAQDVHVKALEGIIAKAGLDEQDMIMKPAVPCDTESNEERIRLGLPPRKIYHNCAGKHLSLMLLQRKLTGSVKDYWRIESKAQQAVLETIASVSEVNKEDVTVGVDGCGVPVFAVPIKNIACAFKNLARPEKMRDQKLGEAALRFVPMINRNPIMMRGRGFVCGNINRDSNLIGKGGAMGVYGIGLKNEGLGISLKIADGTDYLWPFLIAGIFRRIGYNKQETLDMLEKLNSGIVYNDNGLAVGSARNVFELK
ncbi:MAG: asparaginase [Clostridiaceae bacterium]|nr:asparaginase [Clostridiaceae bacterium]